MPVRILLLASLVAFISSVAAQTLEHRDCASWPTSNQMRWVLRIDAPAGTPFRVTLEAPADFNPDSVRVFSDRSAAALPRKVEWRPPQATVYWISQGPGAYHVYFDRAGSGETQRPVEPAMIGGGDRVGYGRPDVRGRLAVGLWAYPAALDADGDGDLDLVVSCTDRPSNGTYLFVNLGDNRKPLFDRGEWLGPGKKDLLAADFNGDGKTDLVTSGGYYSDFPRNRLSHFVFIELDRDYHVGRDDLWHPIDWDGDGAIDLLVGTSDWREYGWDDAYDEQGRWTRGPLHGYVYFHRNIRTNENPRYAAPVKLQAGGQILDLYGSPSPNPVDWFGRGVLDLIGGSFLDTITLFRNSATRQAPRLEPGELLRVNGEILRMDLCMIQPRVVCWHPDGRPSLIVGEEDGTVAFIENAAPYGRAPQLRKPQHFQQRDPYLKSGALARPVAVDWNGDGLLDLIVGNSAGYIQYFENTGDKTHPAFVDRGYLQAGRQTIRHLAGPNGSVQGPAEAKWGYTNPSVADWDLDGDLDLIVNDIRGEVVWYRNTGTRRRPELARAEPLEVEWPGRPPKPDWVWWEPRGKQLVTQWRTTPKVVDWDGDGLPDLVMLDYRGYLALYRRQRSGQGLILRPPERIFLEPSGRFLYLARGRGGASGRRKIEFADWDGDGDLDLLTDSEDGPVWYENVGTQAKPVMALRGLLLPVKIQGHNPTPNAADWNGDGKPDLLVGAEDGFLYYFERSFLDAQAAREELHAMKEAGFGGVLVFDTGARGDKAATGGSRVSQPRVDAAVPRVCGPGAAIGLASGLLSGIELGSRRALD